jgi:hypothetical protein
MSIRAGLFLTLKRCWDSSKGDELLDLIARLAELILNSRVNLTCQNGVFAPISPHRAAVHRFRGQVLPFALSDDRQWPLCVLVVPGV